MKRETSDGDWMKRLSVNRQQILKPECARGMSHDGTAASEREAASSGIQGRSVATHEQGTLTSEIC